MRANPDPFDERPNAPVAPLAASTCTSRGSIFASQLLSLSRAASRWRSSRHSPSWSSRSGSRWSSATTINVPMDSRTPSPSGLAMTLIQVAHHHLGASLEQVAQLKRIAAKLPAIPLELTAKNKAFLRQFESDRLKAELLFLPERLMLEVRKALEKGRVDFVKAQVAIAIEFQLAIPLRPQNLSRLNWGRHFLEPDGPKGSLLLHLPKAETKSGKEDFTAEIPDHVVRRLRWYRRADPAAP